MTKHMAERVYFDGLKREIGFEEQPILSIHKSDFESWKVEFVVYEEEQAEFFKNALLSFEPIEVTIYVPFMSRLTGKVIVQSVKDNEIIAKGTSFLNGYRSVYKRGKFVTAY
ncbi:transposase [Bacillus toyonensis]|uniref:transposase n=1 Tax=Bacillus toyonensis TaxID=155322 RepID=UPI002E200869|nr:transposase [Bacillus toyonensis]